MAASVKSRSPSAITLSAALVLLTSVMQSLLAGLPENHTIYGGLHG